MTHVVSPLALTNLFPTGICSGICLGSEWYLAVLNQGVADLLARQPEALLGEGLFSALSKRQCRFEIEEFANKNIGSIFVEDQPFSLAWTFLPADDVLIAELANKLPAETREHFLQQEEKQIRYFILHQAAKYSAEAECTLLKRELQVVLDSVNDGVWVIDADGITVHVNKALHRITGIKDEDVVGRHVSAAMHEGLYSSCVTLHALEAQKSVTMFDDYASGKRCINTSTPIFDDKGNVWRVIASIRDMSELEMLQAKLAEAEQEASFCKERLQSMTKESSVRFVGESATLRQSVRNLDKVARLSSSVLLLGETGTGKTLAAAYVHEKSPRVNNPFISVNCAAIPLSLLESELFGYEKGAFTGATHEGKKGMFELADTGTLFLDEIGELPLAMQAKLLHVLDNYSFRRVGGVKNINVDVRIIAATNQPLEELVKSGQFRSDLYYRLRVLSVFLPALKDYAEDIPLMAVHFLGKVCARYRYKKFFDPKVLDYFCTYNWPGNVRELIATVEFLAAMSEGKVIRLRDLPPYLYSSAPNTGIEDELEGQGLKEAVQQLEYSMIKNALAKAGSTYKAAEILGISQSSVVRKARALRIAVVEK